MQLRDYQSRAIELLREHVHERPILVLPTGAGKTVVMGEIVRLARGRVLFLCHRRELVDQAVERFAAFGIDCGEILAGRTPEPEKRVQVASIPTLCRRKLPPAELVIVDEAHHASSDTWERIIQAYDDSYLIGCTATPFRLDGKPLGHLFGKILPVVTSRELCDQGVLVEPRVFSHPIGKIKARVAMGDYVLGELGEAMAKKNLVGDIVSHWIEHGAGRTVAFAVNVLHSKMIRDAFLERGIPAEHLDGKTPAAERAAILDRLASGETQIVSNCMVLGEGFDCPVLDTAILARPTKSLGLYLQQIGRIMRSAPAKTGALVLDHAGNVVEHGHPLQEIEYSLTDKARPKPETCPVKLCKVCFAQIPLNSTECPECGSIAPQEPKDQPHVSNPGALEEYTEEVDRVNRREQYRELVAYASRQRYRLGWARFQFKQRTGTWPRYRDVEEEEYFCVNHQIEEKVYGNRVVTRCARCLRPVGQSSLSTGI